MRCMSKAANDGHGYAWHYQMPRVKYGLGTRRRTIARGSGQPTCQHWFGGFATDRMECEAATRGEQSDDLCVAYKGQAACEFRRVHCAALDDSLNREPQK